MSLPDTTKVVMKLVNQYAERFPSADKGDLEGVANLAAEEARQRFDPTKGAAVSSYVWRCVNTMLYRHVTKGTAPVHISKHKLGDAFSMKACALSETDQIAIVSPEALLDKARAYRRLRDVISASGGLAATKVLLGESHATEVAIEMGLPVSKVRAAAKRARRAIREDYSLRRAASVLQ